MRAMSPDIPIPGLHSDIDSHRIVRVGELPPPRDAREVERLLARAKADGRVPGSDLLPLVYKDLRSLAAARMAALGPGQTLQATDLVHEAYLRLTRSGDVSWQGRAHFYGAAARAMREILADHLQRRASLKRGGHYRRLDGDAVARLSSEGPGEGELAVEELLQEFERLHPRPAEVVTLTYFGGLTAPDIAEVLGLSSRTVERDWAFAKAWLNGRLQERESGR